MTRTISYVGYLSIVMLIFYPVDQLMGDILNISNYEKFSPLRYATILYLIFSLSFISKNRKLYTYKYHVIIFLIILWFYISSIWAANSGYSSVLYATKLLLLASFLYSSLFLLGNKISLIPHILFIYALTSGLLSFYIFNSTDLIGQSALRLSFKTVGVNALMVSLGYSLIIGVSYLLFESERKIKKVAVMLSIIVISIVVFLGGTRSVFWGGAVSLLIAYVYLFFKSTGKNKIYVIMFFLLLFYGGFSLIESNYFSEGLLERMLIFDRENMTENSRLSLWSTGLEWYTSNVLGSGAGNEHYIYSQLGYDSKDEAHNTFVSTLIQTGIIGLTLLVMLLLFLGGDIIKIKNINYKFLAVSLYIFFIIQLMKGSFFQTRLFWQPLFILLLMVEIDKYSHKLKITTDKG